MKAEIRSDRVRLEGYVNAVGRDSRILSNQRGKFVEQVEPGTFAKALRRADKIELRFNHRPDRVIGSTTNNTLSLHEDAIGLKACAETDDPEVMEKARRGELRGWSFSFRRPTDRWEEWKDGVQRRYLEDLELLEISVLDKAPAYIGTLIEERDSENGLCEERYFAEDFEVDDRTGSVAEVVDQNPYAAASYRNKKLKLEVLNT